MQVREDKCKEGEESVKRLKSSHSELEAKHADLAKCREELETKLRSTVEQLGIVATTAKRDQELLTAKESESRLLRDELQIIKKYCDVIENP